jgi:two-component system, OmpR family, response regulator CpxR
MKTSILLVDDEREFVDVLAQRLEVRGFTVSTAYGGDEAAAKVREQSPDVVVLDVVMPGRNGIDTLQEIKRLDPLVEVIMLSGHSTVQTAIDGMKLGAFDYLIKPADTNDLIEKITQAHGRKSGQEERIRQAEIANIIGSKGW